MQTTARAALAAAMIAAAASFATGEAAAQQPVPQPAQQPAAEPCNALCQLVRGIGGDRNPPGARQAAAPPQATGQPPLALETAKPKHLRRAAGHAPHRNAGTSVNDLATSAVRDAPAAARNLPEDGAAPQAAEATPAKAPAPPAKAGPARLGVLMGPDEALEPILADLGAALGPKVKVEPVRGKAAPLKDLLSLPSVDMAVVSSPMLAEAGTAAAKLVYVAKLFGEELHVVAGSEVRTLEDLAGKAVYLGAPGGDSELVARAALAQRGVAVTPAGGTLAEALVGLREGRIAAVMLLAPKPFAPIAELGGGGGLHLVPVSYAALGENYDPASFSSADYPGLVRDGERVETAAVDAVLIAPWWRESSPRQQELTTASRALMERFPELLKEGRHPKWKETNLAAVVDGKRRLKAADQWVQSQIKRRRAASAAQ
ncbi:hypothetical protein GCM10007036_20830 [Alsobacter metallidurans]|uniref:Uncharacterized protein n=1 Tax=Alsobacter metallidurans TaxID=340221 RepID=A0A917I760_9HYPH|nr:hypothetical protein [Alsobacter metallidurans]GGH18547.1 hypothetical protein GCM10007036_20830 [Alsobacter metallidurans]